MRHDHQLLEAWRAGEESAFETFYSRHRREVYVYVLSWTGDRTTAEDLLQETFLVFLRQLPRLRPTQDLRGCLVRIARSRVIDRLRRIRRESRALEVRSKVDLVRSVEVDFPASSGVDVEKLNRCLWRLPVEQREAVILRAQLGLTFAEIARAVGAAENTVVSRYRYGIRKLRESLVPGGCDGALRS